MIKAHKIRLNLNPEQDVYFRKACGTSRFVFNWGLAEWKRHKAEQPTEEYGVMAIKKDFNAIKGEKFSWVYDVAKDVAEGAFTNLAAAFKNYYDSKNGKRMGARVGFPRFKAKKDRRQSFRLNNDKIKVADHALCVPKLGWVNMSEKLRFSGKIKGAVVSKEANRWYVSITVEMEQPAPIQFAKPSVGIDVGVKTLAVLSDGKQYDNQVLLRSNLNHLKRLNRRLARRKIGSKRWYTAKDQLERCHQRIANQRSDYLHKMTSQIACTYAVIGIEDLNVAGMLKNHHLALSLADASFGTIRRLLTYKSEWLGGKTITVDRFFPSSRTCSHCRTVKPELLLAEREWTCPNCGAHHDRDHNASVNIETEALRLFSLSPVVATSGITLVDRTQDHTSVAVLNEARTIGVHALSHT